MRIIYLFTSIIWIAGCTGLGSGSVSNVAGVSYCQTNQTCYYVDSFSGNDSNTGLSEDQPWKTLTHVNAQTFAPGAAIFLKAGSIFAGQQLTLVNSGNSSLPIEVAAYGSGAQPVIAGSTYGIYASAQNYILINGIHVTGVSDTGIMGDNNSAHWTVENCTVDNFTNVGIHAQSASNASTYTLGWIVSGNTIGVANTSAVINYAVGGIILTYTQGALITRNKVATVNAQAIRVEDFYSTLASSSPTVSYNEILENYTGISIWDTPNAVVTHNYIHDGHGFGIGIGGLGSVSTANRSSNALITYNVIQNMTASQDGGDYNGIDTNSGAINGQIYHNTIENIQNSSITFEGDGGVGNTGWIAKNNILDLRRQNTQNETGGIFWHDDDVPVTSETLSNNLIMSNPNYPGVLGSALSSGGTHTYLAAADFSSNGLATGSIFNIDPQFTSVSSENLSLKVGSPAIGAGVAIAGIGQVSLDLGALPVGQTSVLNF